MKTPPPDQPPAAERLEEIAERTVLAVIGSLALVSYPDLEDRQLWAKAILSALRNERERCARLVTEKRDGQTARYAYGGYSRELWHLNAETLKIVCNELLKEIRQ